MQIETRLFALQDLKYRDFQRKLCPTVDPETILGVRTPDLRALAKELARAGEDGPFLARLPHRYFEENQLHALLLTERKGYGEVLGELERFLPYIDNWATCDQLRPKAFLRNRDKLLREILRWLSSSHPYTVRFAIGMLMVHYLDEDFRMEYPEMVSSISSQEYYVNMMIAWYFATALAKQYEAVLPYLEEKRLSPWVHNKTIQKARESFRIQEAQKAYLSTLKLPSRPVQQFPDTGA